MKTEKTENSATEAHIPPRGGAGLVVRAGRAEAISVLGMEMAFICPAESTGSAWSLAAVTIPEGAGAPPHDHPWDESYWILDGEVAFTVGNDSVTVRAGDFLYAPGGTPHSFRGVAKSSRILIFDAPAASEAFFREVDREVKSLPADLAKLPEIGRRHRLRLPAV